jgi:serralysin
LNGDARIGPPTTVIEANGSTRLTEVGDHFFLYDSGGSGPSLRHAGADVVADQFGSWAPIAAERTASGYEVAWKNGGADQYSVWNTDSSGNYISNIVGIASGADYALQSLEPSFHQDLNGDGHWLL